MKVHQLYTTKGLVKSLQERKYLRNMQEEKKFREITLQQKYFEQRLGKNCWRKKNR